MKCYHDSLLLFLSVDLSLYTDESQLKKRRKRAASNKKRKEESSSGESGVESEDDDESNKSDRGEWRSSGNCR